MNEKKLQSNEKKSKHSHINQVKRRREREKETKNERKSDLPSKLPIIHLTFLKFVHEGLFFFFNRVFRFVCRSVARGPDNFTITAQPMPVRLRQILRKGTLQRSCTDLHVNSCVHVLVCACVFTSGLAKELVCACVLMNGLDCMRMCAYEWIGCMCTCTYEWVGLYVHVCLRVGWLVCARVLTFGLACMCMYAYEWVGSYEHVGDMNS